MGNVLCCVESKRYGDNDYDPSGELAQDTSHESQSIKVMKDSMQYADTESQLQTIAEASEISPNKLQDNLIVEPQVDDHLSDFDIDIDFNQEIEEFTQYRNQFEEDISFSEQGFINAIEEQLQKENSEEEAKKWELKLNKEDVKVYLKKGGSQFNGDQPYIKTEVLFNSYYQMNKILNTIFQMQHRKQWDKNILKYDMIPLLGDNVVLNYQLNKAPLNFQNRDFLDKQIKLHHDGKFYCYYSSIPNDNEVKPIPEKVGRGITYIGMQKMERRPEDGKIKYTMLMQCDLKMNITPKLIGMFLPQGMQDWSRKINKYLMDHYDKI